MYALVSKCRFHETSSFSVLALLCVPAVGGAGIPDFTWGTTQVLDIGVEEIGQSGGRSAEFDFGGDGLWRFVYVKSGDIYSIEGSEAGWSSPGALSNDPAASRMPSIASSGTNLHVVWEDERSGHSEVWARRSSGGVWSDAECLSCDAVPSRAPALDGTPDEDGGYSIVAWQDDLEGGSSSIHARIYSESTDAWGAVANVSTSTSSAMRPAVAVPSDPYAAAFVVWEDARHGETEIYSRRYMFPAEEWEDELRATDLPGNCSRPRISADWCCFDLVDTVPFLVFENSQDSVVECWASYGGFWGGWELPFRISADDGVSSTQPIVSGIKYLPHSCYEYDENLSFVSWTDEHAEGADLHFARYVFEFGQLDDPVAVDAETETALASRTQSPDAPVLQAWMSAGELTVRLGSEFNCRQDDSEVAPFFYVAPAGGANEVYLVETCRDQPIPDYPVQVQFYNGMEDKIALDPSQVLPMHESSNDDGIATFVVRGGGCVTKERAGNGAIAVQCEGWGNFLNGWDRIKSPDIDGTCTVDSWDVQYVQDRQGTDDFCADLDGSGTVNEVDLAIVQAALGDECEQTAEAPDPGQDPASSMQIRVAPNPGSDRFQLQFTLLPEERATLRIADVSGRIVRDFGRVNGSSDGAMTIEWDGRDESGRLVPTGVYFAQAQREGHGDSSRTTMIVTR